VRPTPLPVPVAPTARHPRLTTVHPHRSTRATDRAAQADPVVQVAPDPAARAVMDPVAQAGPAARVDPATTVPADRVVPVG
jgi:hypothetical protein